MSKKTNKMRSETYWREQNYQKIIEMYEKHNDLRGLTKEDRQWTHEQIKMKVNTYDYNKIINANKPMSAQDIYDFAEQFSKSDMQTKYNLTPSKTPSIKQAENLKNAALELFNENLKVEDIVRNPELFREYRERVAEYLNTTSNDAIVDYFMFGS